MNDSKQIINFNFCKTCKYFEATSVLENGFCKSYFKESKSNTLYTAYIYKDGLLPISCAYTLEQLLSTVQ